MAAILLFFGVTGGGGRLKALLILAALLLAACLGLTIWAEVERAGRFKAAADVQKLSDQVAVDAETMTAMSEAARGLYQAGLDAQATIPKRDAPLAKKAATAASDLGDVMSQPPKPGGCGAAWAGIRANPGLLDDDTE